MVGVIQIVARKRVRGYVLLESMFSMVVIMICFGIAMMIFSTITTNSASNLKTNARIRLHTEAEKCKSTHLFLDEDIACEAYIVERRIIPCNENEHVSILELRAVTPEGKTLAEHYEIIPH